MSELTNALERILNWWREHKPADAALFKPGLKLAELQEKLHRLPFQLPNEVYTLYQWHNGTDGDYDECNAFVYHTFMDIDRALAEAEGYMNDEEVQHSREEEGLPTYLFPFCDFEGEYFAIAGIDAETDSTPVYFVSQIYEVYLAFTSLTNMMLALAECYETGIYAVGENEHIEVVDEVKFGEVRLKYNPGTVERIFAEGW